MSAFLTITTLLMGDATVAEHQDILLTKITHGRDGRFCVTGWVAAPHVAHHEFSGDFIISQVPQVEQKASRDKTSKTSMTEYRIMWQVPSTAEQQFWRFSFSPEDKLQLEWEPKEKAGVSATPDHATEQLLHALLSHSKSKDNDLSNDVIVLDGKKVQCKRITNRIRKSREDADSLTIIVKDCWFSEGETPTLYRADVRLYSEKELPERCILYLTVRPQASNAKAQSPDP